MLILPPRFILIDQSNCQAIFALFIVPMNNALWLNYSFNRFSRPLTDTVRQSFKVNESNAEYFKLLSLEKDFEHTIPLSECESLTMTLNSILGSYNSNYNNPIKVKFPKIELYLYYFQIFSIYNYLISFVQNYTYWQSQYINYAQNQPIQKPQQENVVVEPIQLQNNIDKNDAEIEIEQNAIDTDPKKNTDLAILINDALKLAPHDNNIIPYYIIKYVDIILHENVIEKSFEILLVNDTIWIKMLPLIDSTLISLSTRHYETIYEIYNSFDYTQSEYYVRIRELVKFMIHLIKMYYDDKEQNSKSILIPFKILEFLLFLYSLKIDNDKDILDVLPFRLNYQYSSYENLYLTTVNKYINLCLESLDRTALPFSKIMIYHPDEELTKFEDTDNDEIIADLFRKENYLLSVNQQDFIDLVYSKTIEEKNKSYNTSSLVLHTSKLLDINSYLNKSDINDSSLLNYKIIIPEEKRFKEHKIITPEYFQLLKIATTPSFSLSLFQKDINPILSLNYDAILQHIYKELNGLDTTVAISTLHLLTTYIKPFLSPDSTVKTELFILYRTVIPYIYDLCKISTFIDYFY